MGESCGRTVRPVDRGGQQSVLEQAPTMQQPAFALSLALFASSVFAQGNSLHFLSSQFICDVEMLGHVLLVKGFSSGQLLLSVTGAWEEQS